MPQEKLFEILEFIFFAATLLFGGAMGVLIGHARTRTLLWVICISSGVIVFYFIARILKNPLEPSDMRWLLWSSLSAIAASGILFGCLHKWDLVGEARDIRLKIQRDSADRIEELLLRMKPEITGLLKEINIQQVSKDTLIELNNNILRWLSGDKNKGWTFKGRMRFFYELIQYMDNHDIGLLKYKENKTWDELIKELEKYKVQPDSALLHQLRDYQEYVTGMGYEQLANMYREIPYTTLQEAVDDRFLDSIKVDIAKRLKKLRYE